MKRKNANEKPIELDISAQLPKDATWRLLGTVLDDLEVCKCDYPLHAAIRRRSVEDLLSCLSRYDARSIIERLDAERLSYVETFGKLYQVGALLKKFPFSGLDTYTPALNKFLSCEEKCRLYNTQNHRALIKLSKSHPRYFGVLEELREEIFFLLGAAPNIEEVYIQGKHGPGQTAGGQFRNGMVTEYFKLTTLPYTVTASARTHAVDCISSDPRWIGALMDFYRESKLIPQTSPINMDEFWNFVLKIQECSTITSVPKTALTDRFIAMEPTFNVFLQLGVDSVIREKLLNSWGYNLNSQEPNQDLAQEGSLSGLFATIDLVGASDMISLVLLFLLLPPEWISLILDLRVKSGTTKDGRLHIFSKVSSMGNGFTFALESLIFGACTRVAMRRTKCQRKRSAVYGDDIVCPTEAVALLTEILGLCGFEINSEKSFISGPFRESCGKDFYLGHDVRPLFVTKEFGNVPSLFHLYNSFVLLEKKWEWPYGITFQRTKQLLLSWIPIHFVQECRGPITESTDTHLFTDSPLRKTGKGRYFSKLIEKPRLFKPSHQMGYKTFHLRKLIAKLSNNKPLDQFGYPLTEVVPKWDWRKKLNTGNAFDITRRGHTFHKVVRSYVA